VEALDPVDDAYEDLVSANEAEPADEEEADSELLENPEESA